jgi:hypothetical protein
LTSSLPRPRTWIASQRLADEFPTIPPTEIVAILIDARRSVELFGLSPGDELGMAEKIAREQLRQQTSDAGDRGPRLDPENHRRRKDLV